MATIKQIKDTNGITHDIIDTKCTSVDNHYIPTTDIKSQITATLSGDPGEYTLGSEYTVLTGITLERDAKGHVTNLTYSAQKVKDTNTNTDTKNTAGATNSDSKLFLVGAPSQQDNVQTYSHDTAYVGTDGCLYSDGKKVAIIGGANEGNFVLSAESAEPRRLIFRDRVNTDDYTDFHIIGSYNGLLCDCTSGGSTQRIASLNKGGTLSLAGGIDCNGINAIGVNCTNLLMFDEEDTPSIAINASGVIRASGAITTTSTITATGLITANGGISTTTILAKGLITANRGISTTTISASGAIATTSTITATGQITANGGISTTTISASGAIATTDAVKCGGLLVEGEDGYTIIIDNYGGITATGNVTAAAFYESSDERLKTFTEDYDINLDNLKNIKTGKFYWNADNTQEINGGVSAQTVEQYFPELVRENDEGFKTVNYDGLAVVAIAAIKKLTDRIEQLEEIVRNK